MHAGTVQAFRFGNQKAAVISHLSTGSLWSGQPFFFFFKLADKMCNTFSAKTSTKVGVHTSGLTPCRVSCADMLHTWKYAFSFFAFDFKATIALSETLSHHQIH